MNSFIDLRQEISHTLEPDPFTLAYSRHYGDLVRHNSFYHSYLFESVEVIKSLSVKKIISESDLAVALWNLGKNPYLDNMIVTLVLKVGHKIDPGYLRRTLHYVLANDLNNEVIVHSILDLSIEMNAPILSMAAIKELFARHKLSQNVLAMILDYCRHFQIGEMVGPFMALLKQAYSDNLKLQIIDYLLGIKDVSPDLMEKIIASRPIYKDYTQLLSQSLKSQDEGLILVQSMFQGDFDEDGKGNNGGVAVLLKNLGNALVTDQQVAMVISLSINHLWTNHKPFIHTFSHRHQHIRLPIYTPEGSQDPYLNKEHFIARYVKRLFGQLELDPDVFHTRYLDNASMAMAILSKNLDKKLVFTLTPDPHRRMTDKNGQFKLFRLNDFLMRLNKINIGDQLLMASQGVLGIGNDKVKSELMAYFPQLMNPEIASKLTMIVEAIDTGMVDDTMSLPKMSSRLMQGIPPSFFDEPVILNVGRLSQLKGQDQLIKAWGNSRFSLDYKLLIVGGDLDKPNEEERAIMDAFDAYISEHPHLKDRFLHLGAMANDQIRLLESQIVASQGSMPNIYFCSSKKEEFGIAILEAMSEGLLTFAPKVGGPRSYIQDGHNGFLVDTSHWSSMVADAEAFLYKSQRSVLDFKGIQARGKKTVVDTFSMDKVSKEMLKFYLTIEAVAA